MSETAGGPGYPPEPFPSRSLAHIQVAEGAIWGLFLCVALVVLLFATMATDFTSGPDLLQFACTAAVTLVLAAFMAGHSLAARGLYAGLPQGRRLLAFFSWIGLARVPFGTIASILTLSALRRERAAGGSGDPAKGRAAGRRIVLFWSLWQAEILAFVGFVVVVNILGARSVSHSKRTMSDIRAIATAVEAYAVDFDVYPKARSLTELAPLLTPAYIKTVPFEDGWGRPLIYETSPDGKSYVIVSAGKDGKFERTDPWSYPEGPMQDDDLDIVFRDGRFIRHVGHVHDPNE